MANRSHAVLAQRFEPRDSRDDFPTPPWATRALCELLLDAGHELDTRSCLEPAAGRGYMVRPLREYFRMVAATDAFEYGQAATLDFLEAPFEPGVVDWVITNPPFRHATAFIQKSLTIATMGVAVLVRTVFLESTGRWATLFRDNPPTTVATFAERVPIVRGRLDQYASSATSYSWFIWVRPAERLRPLMWIAPCRSHLEDEDDYRGRFGPLGLIPYPSDSRV